MATGSARMLYGERVDRTIPPRTGRDQVLRLTERPARGAAPAARDVHGPGDRCWRPALRSIKRRSLVVIVSDFISAPGWERPLALLARRHEVLAIRVHDPREATLPDVGPLVMADAETGEQLVVDTHDRAFRARFEDGRPAAGGDAGRRVPAGRRRGAPACPPTTTWCARIVRMATRGRAGAGGR